MGDILKIFPSVLTSIIITLLTLPLIISFSRKKALFDIPDRRKIHADGKASMGGIAIFLGFFVSIIIWGSIQNLFQNERLNYLYGAIFLVFVAGISDDVMHLKAIHKIIIQITTALVVVHFCQIRLESLYGLLGIYQIPDIISYTISVFTIIVITNAFNLIDGIDGLASSIAIIILFSLGTWYYLIGKNEIAFITFTLLGSVIAFLKFNWEPSRIFMGDTGSLPLGFINSVLLIMFIDTNFNLPDTNVYKIKNGIAAASALAIIPLFDTIRIFILRIFRKKSPLHPDKRHIHHLLLYCKFKHSWITGILSLLNILFIGFVLIFESVEENSVIISIILIATILTYLLQSVVYTEIYIKKKRIYIKKN